MIIIRFAELDASPYARDTSISGFLWGSNGPFKIVKDQDSQTHRPNRFKAVPGRGACRDRNRRPDEGSRSYRRPGFYKHFNSRDDLVAEAVVSALEVWKRQVDAAASGGPPVTYESLVDDYLSQAHRNHPGTGCPVSALAGDIARSDKRTRALVTRQIRDNIELVATLIRDTNAKDRSAARSKAMLTYCGLVGAIGVARAVSDERLSSEILKTVAQFLKDPLLKAASVTSPC